MMPTIEVGCGCMIPDRKDCEHLGFPNGCYYKANPMTPTPEQIERLRTQFERNHWDIRHRVDGKSMPQEDSDAIIAALTAAAGVGEPVWKIELNQHYAIVEQAILDEQERCAQVANNMQPMSGVAAAIRALKDKP